MANTNLESLSKLIKEVQEYMHDLNTYGNVLKNAANVCSQVMGNDTISSEHIKKLNEALAELQKTAGVAAHVAEELIAEKKAAIDIITSI